MTVAVTLPRPHGTSSQDSVEWPDCIAGLLGQGWTGRACQSSRAISASGIVIKFPFFILEFLMGHSFANYCKYSCDTEKVEPDLADRCAAAADVTGKGASWRWEVQQFRSEDGGGVASDASLLFSPPIRSCPLPHLSALATTPPRPACPASGGQRVTP